MKINFYYSACVGIQTENFSLLCDPWFSSPAYEGAWGHESTGMIYPENGYDYIYISHLHPDHLDRPFLKQYLKNNKETRLLICNRSPNFLVDMMEEVGLNSHITWIRPKGIEILPDDPDNKEAIDSALIVRADDSVLVNLNDCPMTTHLFKRLPTACDVMLASFTSAGPYPQTYKMSEERFPIAREIIILKQINQYFMFKEKLHPRYSIPFAGQYRLLGDKAEMNKRRAVISAKECVEKFDIYTGVYLKEGDQFNVDNGKTTRFNSVVSIANSGV